MYQALYRKYRSQTFDEMVGQTVISTTLKQAVASGKISHAYLFSGPRGTGKTSAAKIFAKAMNCPNQVDGEPCNHCDICRDITNGSLEDVIEIDAASNNGVDEIREIRDKSTYAPSRATYKVYIIDEVHMLSTGAFNALLKTLEEPTENVVFILATTELHKIPATILSRVQRFEFKAIKLADIREHLVEILEKEGIGYDPDALTLIARCAEGGMRDALSILDQALSLTTDNQVSLAIAEEITGSISMVALDDFVANVLANQTTQALANLETIFNNGKSMNRFATELLNYFRDLLVVQSGGELMVGFTLTLPLSSSARRILAHTSPSSSRLGRQEVQERALLTLCLLSQTLHSLNLAYRAMLHSRAQSPFTALSSHMMQPTRLSRLMVISMPQAASQHTEQQVVAQAVAD